VAQLVTTSLIDDRDGSVASQTVSFALDGKNYEIDLNDRHADQLREALAPYVAAARRVGGGAARATRVASVDGRRDLSAARAWLAEHGYPVKERGRVPHAWIADFEAQSPNPPQDVERPTPGRKAAVSAPVFQSAG
jgi:hypothetical protein